MVSMVEPGYRGIVTPGWVRDPLWARAQRVPTLDLRFAANRSLRDAVTGRELVTFTRASTATVVGPTGLIETVANDVPRFQHDPLTGQCLGLLVEEQRANLLLRSEESGTTWIPVNLTVTSDSTTAPIGTLTADTLIEDSSLGTHVLQQSASVVNGTAYTLSCYAKPAGRNFAQLLLLGGFATNITAIFDITTGVVGTTAGSPVVTSTNVGNGWYRLSITATATSTTATTVQLRPAGSSSTAFYQGDGTSGIYIWGAQLEAGAFPTSYIKTEGTGATRSADIATITTLGSSIRSLFAQVRGPASGTRGIIGLDDNSVSNRIELLTSGTDPKLLATTGGSAVADLDGGTVTANVEARLAARFAADNYAISVGGGAEVVDVAGALPAVDRIRIGALQAGSTFSGTIARLTAWDQVLPNLRGVSQ
jgi:hypothetical protein